MDVPLGVLVAVTGVAGSGKSSLIHGCLPRVDPKVTVVDQSAIKGSRRSNPATYTGMLDGIRKAYASANGVKPALFSANSEGACPDCRGLGLIYTDLAMMAGVVTICETCGGKRFTDEVLGYKLRDKNISEVLEMSVEDAQAFFTEKPIRVMLDRLSDVGLGYISLGQMLNTLSGGERQRLKLAIEMSGDADVFVLDEPTSGLHMHDVDNLIGLMDRLVEIGSDGDRDRAQPGRRRACRLGHRPRARRRPRWRPDRVRGHAIGSHRIHRLAHRPTPPPPNEVNGGRLSGVALVATHRGCDVCLVASGICQRPPSRRELVAHHATASCERGGDPRLSLFDRHPDRDVYRAAAVGSWLVHRLDPERRISAMAIRGTFVFGADGALVAENGAPERQHICPSGGSHVEQDRLNARWLGGEPVLARNCRNRASQVDIALAHAGVIVGDGHQLNRHLPTTDVDRWPVLFGARQISYRRRKTCRGRKGRRSE